MKNAIWPALAVVLTLALAQLAPSRVRLVVYGTGGALALLLMASLRGRQRHTPKPIQRPVLVVDYAVDDVWSWPAPESGHRNAAIRNTGSRDALHVRISNLKLDGITYKFPTIDAVPAGAVVALGPVVRIAPTQSGRMSLTAAISTFVVAETLAGRPVPTEWSVTLRYEDVEGRLFESVCEIRTERFPLHVRARTVSAPDRRDIRRPDGRLSALFAISLA